ncbi:hypothetical protein AYL99_00567 [Fonsecaea erecta]|uniref:Uncharacterized protein n=1 Tax=Fonsecaea erecta TaxID=1367422 RepID=A0A179A041_9EURO|nr:hypothetical protein AYL99_00567 [Fonsecaea erecta]OAP64595.1 hypothetical protein AYL99_00567 [Fonsecaea erecta]
MPESNNKGLHSFKTNVEVAAMAGSGVYAANELGKAVAEDYKDASDHYVKAAVGAAVAVGAFQLLKKQKREREEDDYASSDDEEHHHRHEPRPRRHSHHEHHHEHSESPGHTRRLLEEAVGAYSLGKELLGDRRHHVIHLVTEALGAVAAVKEVNDRSKEAREV